MARASWDENLKQKALAIAAATSAQEAERETGIPAATIRSWRRRLNVATDATCNGNDASALHRNGQSKKINKIAEEAVQEAKAEVREFVAGRAMEVTNKILAMVELAIDEAKNVINEGPNDDEPQAGWLRAIIGAMGQGVEKYQLLTGKPTARQAVEGQVTQRYEYDITQRILSDPEARETARNLFRRAVNTDLGS